MAKYFSWRHYRYRKVRPYITNDFKIFRIQLIRERTKAIEEESKRKEALLKVKGSELTNNNEVNDLLINAIETKLALLENIK